MERKIDKPQNEMMLVNVMSARLDEIKANHSYYYYKENQRYYKMLIQQVGNVPVASVTKAQINRFLLEYSKKCAAVDAQITVQMQCFVL